MCILVFECDCVMYEVLLLPLGEFYGEVVQNGWGGARIGFNVSTKGYECGIIPYVIFYELSFKSF